MGKYKFDIEFEIKASPRVLYPYISTASGLSGWFAEKVNINNITKEFHFVWDNEDHYAKMTAHKVNHHVKFEFIPETKEDEEDPSYIEIHIETNDLTQTTYLRITDYSDIDDEEEVQELWVNQVNTLKETVGG